MTDPIWLTKMLLEMLLDWDEIYYSWDFWVADYESELNIQKIAMADSTWLTKLFTVFFLVRCITFKKIHLILK